jgi:hypothetical protein
VSEQPSDPTWKLKLRYGRTATPYSHFTVIAEGTVGDLAPGFSCPRGPAFMGMKTWALSLDESADMMSAISRQVGFRITGSIEVFVTEPQEPPRDKPFGYDITFTPFDPSA